MEITTKYSDLPDDVKSALAEINTRINVAHASIAHPTGFEDAELAGKISLEKASQVIQQLLED